MRPSSVAAGLFLVCVAACTTQPPAPATMGDTVLRNLSPIEKKVLADKYVTRAEAEQALQAEVECYRSHGAEVVYDSHDDAIHYADWLPGEDFNVKFNSGSDPNSPDSPIAKKQDKAVRYCADQVDAIQAAWEQQFVKSKQERQSAENNFVLCLRTAGAPANQTSTFGDATTWLSSQQKGDGTLSPPLDKCNTQLENQDGPAPLPGFAAALAKLKVK